MVFSFQFSVFSVRCLVFGWCVGRYVAGRAKFHLSRADFVSGDALAAGCDLHSWLAAQREGKKVCGLAGAAPSRFPKGNRCGVLCVHFLTGAACGEGVGPGDCCVLEVVNRCYKGVNF